MDKARLDYIFQLSRGAAESPRMVCEHCRVEKFPVNGKKYPFMSDHFGVACDCFLN